MASVNQTNEGNFSVSFQVMTDEEIDQLVNDMDSKGTKKVLKFATCKLVEFAKFTGTDLEEIAKDTNVKDLDKFLTKFYSGIRKDNGESYKTRSLQNIRFGVQRYFVENYGVDIGDSSKFPQANRVFKAVKVKAKK